MVVFKESCARVYRRWRRDFVFLIKTRAQLGEYDTFS